MHKIVWRVGYYDDTLTPIYDDFYDLNKHHMAKFNKQSPLKFHHWFNDSADSMMFEVYLRFAKTIPEMKKGLWSV